MQAFTPLLFITIIFLPILCESARILALIPYNARSHFIIMEPLLLALHSRGHDVTVVSSFPQKGQLKDYRDIDFSHKLPAAINNYTVESIKKSMPNVFKTVVFITKIHLDVCHEILREEQVLKLLDEKFDLVIGEIFGADCFNYMVHKMNIPLISFVTSTSLPWAADRMGLPDNPSYIPNYFMDYGAKMNFVQRLFNTITLIYAKTAYYYFSSIPSQRFVEEVFKETLPSMEEVNQHTSIVFVNSHISLSQSRPFPPNVIEIGGIHIKEVQPLPQDIKHILDTAKAGVILFSFGSLVRVSSLPPSVIRMFLDVFAMMPQQVIFKYEDSLSDVPPNVHIRKWLPQTDIIAHPNVKAVVTHCGLASTIEAVHFAKPLVGVPFFSDQFLNVKNVMRRGGGLMLDLDTLSPKTMLETFRAVLNDPSYTTNMKHLSLQFRDRPMTALQTAVYWTEFVIRHQGAPHLQPASVHLPFYQYLLLDVISLLIISVTGLIYSFRVLTPLLINLICSRSKQSHGQTATTKNIKKID